MKKRYLFSIMVIVAALTLVGAGAFAVFSDTETSSGNTFTAGTLDLKVDDQDDPNVVTVSLSNMKPGDCGGTTAANYWVWCLKNVGTVDGKPWIEFGPITNDDNGCNEPETDAEESEYGAGNATPGADPEGELGQYLKTTIGVGPCTWSVPSLLISNWQTGPTHPWGTPGLNGFGGNSYFQGPTGYQFPVLGPGETYGFFLKVCLDNDLQIWDGTKWIDVDDNIIQSDSVTFDIIFHMEQAP